MTAQEAILDDLAWKTADECIKHFGRHWCEDCERHRNGACPEDFYDDMCPQSDQLQKLHDAAVDFWRIMREACK